MSTSDAPHVEPGREPLAGGWGWLWIAAAWSGAVMMAFELIGARLLMPTFGMGIDVWAAVIATTLGSLSIGCALGGRWVDARPRAATLGWMLFLVGASLFAVLASHRYVIAAFTEMPFVTGAWSAAAATLAPPLVLLGMIQPTLARLMVRQTDRAGAVFGGLLAVSTLGGVAGTALTALVLIPRAGVVLSLLTVAIGTTTLAAAIFVTARRWRAAVAVLLLGSVAATARATLNTARNSDAIETVEGRYGLLEVIRFHGGVALLCDGIFQTALPSTGAGLTNGTLIRGGDFVELLPYYRPHAKTALLIGLGGGLHEQALAPHGIAVHAVEIDPAVARLAARHFGLSAEVTIADGRAFLARDARRFDAVVLDAFLGSSIPEHLYTREAFAAMADHLAPDGVLAVHLIARPQHLATDAVASTLHSVFANVAVASAGWSNELQHVYLFASREPLDLAPEDRLELDRFGFTGRELRDVDAAGQPVLTDDRTNLALLCRDLVTEHRRESLERRRHTSW